MSRSQQGAVVLAALSALALGCTVRADLGVHVHDDGGLADAASERDGSMGQQQTPGDSATVDPLDASPALEHESGASGDASHAHGEDGGDPDPLEAEENDPIPPDGDAAWCAERDVTDDCTSCELDACCEALHDCAENEACACHLECRAADVPEACAAECESNVPELGALAECDAAACSDTCS